MSKSIEYFVVCFDEYISTVPSTWVDWKRNMIFWPPKQILSTKMASIKIEHTTWYQYPLKKCLGPFDSLDEALKVEKSGQFMNTSEDSEAFVKGVTSMSEKRLKKKKTCPSSISGHSMDESDNSDFEQTNQTQGKKVSLKIPPSNYKRSFNEANKENLEVHEMSTPSKKYVPDKISNGKAKSTLQAITDNVSCSLSCLRNESSLNEFSGLNHNSIEHSAAMNSLLSDMFPNRSNELNNNSVNDPDAMKETLSDISPLQEFNIVNAPISVSKPILKDVKIVKDYLKTKNSKSSNLLRPSDNTDSDINNTPLTKQEYLVYHEQLLKKLNKLTNLYKLSTRTSKNDNDDHERILPDFPLKEVDQLDDLETLLQQSAQARDDYRDEIKEQGGKSVTSCVNRALYHIMEDELAYKYTWSGTRNSSKIKDKLIIKLMLRTIAKAKTFQMNDLEEKAKSWIWHANDRIKNKKKNI